MSNRLSTMDKATGRWRGILSSIGIEDRYLKDTHGPCPICGGKDRFRFDDKDGRGTFFCSKCGAGSGIDLVMQYKGCDFQSACKAVDPLIGNSPIVVGKRAPDNEKLRDQMQYLWGTASLLDGTDLGSRYLQNRGITKFDTPFLRFIEKLPFFDDETKQKSIHPALLAKFVAADRKSSTLYRIYLSEPGMKAPSLAPNKQKKMAPGQVPKGGAVRLGLPAHTMGIAEGIETALAASEIFGLPVWATTGTGNLMKWEPPSEARNIIVFGDLDGNYAGHAAAYALAHRLATLEERAEDDVRRKRFDSVEVRFPDREEGDWNDVLIGSTVLEMA